MVWLFCSYQSSYRQSLTKLNQTVAGARLGDSWALVQFSFIYDFSRTTHSNLLQLFACVCMALTNPHNPHLIIGYILAFQQQIHQVPWLIWRHQLCLLKQVYTQRLLVRFRKVRRQLIRQHRLLKATKPLQWRNNYQPQGNQKSALHILRRYIVGVGLI